MTRDIILKRYERGMTAEQISTLDNLSLAHVEEVISSSGVQPTERNKPVKKIEPVVTRRKGRQPSVPDEKVVAWFKEGLTIGQIKSKANISYSGIKNRLMRLKLIDANGNPIEVSEVDLAKQEVAVTTEADGFESNYTIAALVKEEPEMTEAIAEVKKDAQEAAPAPVETTEGVSTWELLEEAQRKENAKWIHFIASQMQNAVITSTLDVEDRNGQLVKVEKVTFTRVQTL